MITDFDLSEECTYQAAAPRAPKILVVDSDPITRDLIQRILWGEGFRTITAADCQQALEFVSTDPIDLILAEMVLPGPGGMGICRGLQAERSIPPVPVIFLSSLDDPESRVSGLHAGGVDYIAKPFLAEEVLARVRVHLRLHRDLKAAAQRQQVQLAELRNAQRSILVRPEDLPEASFAVSYRPRDAVGGDFFDVHPLGEMLFGYFVADISGHGVGASFLTSALKALLRQYSGPLYSPEDTMHGMNRVVHTVLPEGHFLTACYVRYCRRNGRATIVTGGHPAPIHVSADGKSTAFMGESDPLGVFPAVILECRDMELRRGDRIFLYTDGLIEDPALPGGWREPGLHRLRQACERFHSLPLQESVDAITEEVRPHRHAAADDLLLLAVEAKA